MIGFYPFLKAFGWFPLFQPINKRVKTFKAFTKKYLPNTRVIDSVSLKELTSTYSSAGTNPLDFVLIGSDQVWNPSYIVNYGKVFASFVEKEKRRSFATSFGVSKIPKNKISKFIKGLSEIPFISTRETAGAELVMSLTSKPCPTLLDPTLVLNKADWVNITNDIVDTPKEKYILCYFLTGKSAYRKWVKSYAKENGLKIVNINDVRTKYFHANPLEFIKLILNATLVCTDSFHGHALSICLEKPFVSFHTKKSTSSRIETILKLTGLEERNYLYLRDDKVLNIDYTSITPILDKEREVAYAYLNKVLTKGNLDDKRIAN